MNLDVSNFGYKLKLKIPDLRDLLDDYYKQDLSHILLDSSINTNIYFAIGDKSEIINSNDQQKLINIADTYIIKNSGHYVHIDNPDDLLEIVVNSLV